VGSTISFLIGAAKTGDSAAADMLFSTLYSELHRLAKRELARRGSPASLSATTLLHEAYLDIAARKGNHFPDRPRFMGYAARVMPGLIIDHARSRNAIKRGGEFEITSLKTDADQNLADRKELSAISDALDQLAKVDPRLHELVDMRFFLRIFFRRNRRPWRTCGNVRYRDAGKGRASTCIATFAQICRSNGP
jgi:RNA polymerase sigma factor (TIGR02999 family)